VSIIVNALHHERALDLSQRHNSTETIANRRLESRKLDELDIKIIAALMADAEISSAALAKKFNKPLSTIQRRRTKIQRYILSRKYTINPVLGNYRIAHLMILTSKGNADSVASHLFEKNPQLSRVVIGLNSTTNILATLYFKETETLHQTMQEISQAPFVENVHFFEPVKLVGERDMTFSWLMEPKKKIVARK
jgi:DNA-binding Lrp family transcriptional regulator